MNSIQSGDTVSAILRSLVLCSFAVLLSGCDSPENLDEAQAAVAAPVAPIVGPAVEAQPTTRYFFDVHGHTAEEITALLERARTTHDDLPESVRDNVTIAMVLHGPDIAFFANDNYAKYHELVDLAASLDALGYVDLKICAASVRSRGLNESRFPPFLEFVPFGPVELRRLESDGFVRL